MDELVRQKSSSQSWKVKVYLLNGTGNWDDCGTGILEMAREIQDQEEIEYLKVTTNEELIKGRSTDITADRYEKLKGKLAKEEKTLLYLPLLKKNQYEKQGESIIAWIDKGLDEEIAISFLDTIAANETWRNICARTGKNPIESKRANYKDLERLTMPDITNLDKIKHDVETRRDWMVCAIQNNPVFLKKLKEVFEKLEDLESAEELMIIQDIVKNLIFCDDSSFIELLLSEEHYMLVFGAFEYELDSGSGLIQRAKHRQFLTDKSVFKKVIEIEDPNIIEKIRINYRVNYLRDSVIIYYVDDQTSNTFSTIVYYNNYEIYEHIINHNDYIKKLFNNFCENLEDSICFLSEFIQIVKSIVQNDAKFVVQEKFQQNDVFTHLTEGLEQLSKMEMIEAQRLNVLKIRLVEVISFLLQIQISPFFNFLKSNDRLLKCLTSTMYEGDQGLQILIGDLFKLMLDNSQDRKTEVIDYFYGTILPKLLEQVKKVENKQSFVNFTQEVIEILNYCIISHNTRIRHFIIQHKVIQDIYKCFKLNNKTIILAIIRMLKNIIGSKDEFLTKHIANYNLLNDIFKVYFENSHKYNLTSSACLELFEKIRNDNAKKLISNIVENFKDEIVKRNLQKNFEKIFLKYEQYNEVKTPGFKPQEPEPINSQASNDMTKYLNSREINEMEDEEYFEKDGDDENAKEETKVSNPNQEKEEEKFKTGEAESNVTNHLEENIKSSVDTITKIRNTLKNKNKDSEEPNFKLNRSLSNSSDRSSNSIKIQITLGSMENNSNGSEGSEHKDEEKSEKRRGSQESAEEAETFEQDPQKKECKLWRSLESQAKAISELAVL